MLCGLVACQSTPPTTPLPGDVPAPLRLGINPAGAEDTALFEPLEDGDALAIEFGFQGLWMVVLAFQSEGLEGRITVVARIRTETDTTLGEFGLAKQELVSADDGHDYYLNLYLVVEGIDAVGQRAWVELEVEDAHGVSLEHTVEVVLTGSDDLNGAPMADGNASTDDALSSEGDIGPESLD